MEKGANKLFKNEDYIHAFPLYSQLLSLDVDNPELNYRFGVCLLYADRSDTYAPIGFLRKAVDQVDDPRLYYYLAYAYHINYYFQAAISNYLRYLNMAGGEVKRSYEVSRKIEMCQNGMEMLHSVKDLYVIEKTEVPREEFFRSYQLYDYNAEIIYKPDAYLTKSEKKNNDRGLILISNGSLDMFYSSYHHANKIQRDIYVRHKTDEGWSNPKVLPSVINTPYDEDFPVMMPDGKTLYFCSKGHNTMGGYDIFMSEYDSATTTWSKPQNLNFPFNTPLDDILFISNVKDSTAWFASVRNSIQGMIMVYKVGVIGRSGQPINLASIYQKDKELTEDDVRQIKKQAQLDINISNEEFKSFSKSRNDALLSAFDGRNSRTLVDRALSLSNKLEAVIESHTRAKRIANSIAISKHNEAELIQIEIKRSLEEVDSYSDKTDVEELIKELNVKMAIAERLEYEAVEMEVFVQELRQSRTLQRDEFQKIKKYYGDVEFLSIRGDSIEAKRVLSQMDSMYIALPQLVNLESKENSEITIEDLVEIQYPSELQNPDTFIAFVVSDNAQSGQLTVASFSGKYDAYFEKVEAKLITVELSTEVSFATKIEDHINYLKMQAQQIDDQDVIIQSEIDKIKNELSSYPESEKQEGVVYLNSLLLKQFENKNKSQVYKQMADDLNTEFMAQQALILFDTEKENNYKQILLKAEKNYDFEQNIFPKSVGFAEINIPILFSLSQTGTLQKVTAAELTKDISHEQTESVSTEQLENISAEILSYNSENGDVIKEQMILMRSQLRSARKANAFTIINMEHQNQKLEQEAQVIFNQANNLVVDAKTKPNDQKHIIDLANKEFVKVKNKKQEADQLFIVVNEMEAANMECEQQLEVLANNNEKIIEAIGKEQWDVVEAIYIQTQEIYHQQIEAINFSEKINMETGELIAYQEESDSVFMAYQITENENIIKNYGNSNIDWNTVEDFSDDVMIHETIQEIQAEDSNIDEIIVITDIREELEFSYDPESHDIIVPALVVPNLVYNSEDSLVVSVLAQLEALETQTIALAQKRNQINTYYQSINDKSEELKQESKLLLDTDRKEAQRIDEERIVLSSKVVASAEILAQFDNQLSKQLQLTNTSLEALSQIQQSISDDNYVEASLMNDQLQIDFEDIAVTDIDDSSFDYAGGVILDTNSIEESSIAVNEVKPIDLLAYKLDDFNSSQDIEKALTEIEAYSKIHVNNIDDLAVALTVMAEQRLEMSNEKSIEAEQATNEIEKTKAQDEARKYLYDALAIKNLLEQYTIYANEEKAKETQLFAASSEIRLSLKQDSLVDSKVLFKEMVLSVDNFGADPKVYLMDLTTQNQQQTQVLDNRMDSAYTLSQDLANESVRLLSEATDERKVAVSKKNAFKRRKLLSKVGEKELKATELQNKSEKALAQGNEFYYQKQLVEYLTTLNTEIVQVVKSSAEVSSPVVVDQSVVFNNIEERKKVVIDGQFNTAELDSNIVEVKTDKETQGSDTLNSIHTYEREMFKAQMVSEELELVKQEIAFLMAVDKAEMTEKEVFVHEYRIKELEQEADSLEYEADKAFVVASSMLELLPMEEQIKAKEKGRDFEDYLNDLKTNVELLLSQASSLKNRAQRSNNMDERTELFGEAKEKETIAIYLILEEFEIIAQKNKSRYRKNKLMLEQMMMEKASLQERALMAAIFTQIDDYFKEAQQKREKANDDSISFNMRKILLQDAYSLEMKALDLQQQAKTMLDNHDVATMLSYQPKEEIEVIAENTTEISQPAIEILESNNNNEPLNNDELVFIEAKLGVVYRVQIMALKEIKPLSFFNGVPEISAQEVKNTNFIRYFSGDFNSVNDAMIRRNSVRVSGYPDAFIKSWNNGQEVSLLSLRDNGANADVSLTENSSQSKVGQVDFSASSISSLKGVYYSVQIGVYSRPRTSSMIYNISPLYHKRANNGYWIYFSGIYKTIAEARSRKSEIVNQGVEDAFVVAFSNGNKVSLSQARQSIDRGEQRPLEEDIVILEDASLQIDSQWTIAQATSVPLPRANEDMVYKIQIGVYSNNISLSWISSQLDGNMKVDSFKNSNGKYVFTLGSFESIAEAKLVLENVKEIVSDAFVVGFSGGNRIYVQ